MAAVSRAQLAKLHSDGFGRAFGPAAELVCVTIAPGRVNLIGEHVDHQLYSVCPAAINQTTRVAVGFVPIDDRGLILQLRHAKGPGVFRSLDLTTLEAPIMQRGVAPKDGWVNYVMAAIYGVLEFTVDPNSVGSLIDVVAGLGPDPVAEQRGSCDGSPQGNSAKSLTSSRSGNILTQNSRGTLSILVDGDIPMAAGVSSSSALVVAIMSALIYTLKLGPVSRSLLGEIACKCERHAGMAGGGMDQAVICLAQKASAVHIGFEPLTAEPVPLPKNAVILVCNSGVQAAKALSFATGYNKRVVELKLAAFIMMRAEKGIDLTPSQLTNFHLRDLERALQFSPKELQISAQRHIGPYPFLKAEIEELLGAERVKALSAGPCGPEVWTRNVSFEPLRRVLHVWSETERVAEFVRMCHEAVTDEEAQLRALGAVLDESGKSLARQFDCSTPELEELTALCREHGAYGARLTGAGWGGCIMALVHRLRIDEVIEAIRTKYFGRENRSIPITIPSDLSSAVFVVSPDNGLDLFDNTGNCTAFFD